MSRRASAWIWVPLLALAAASAAAGDPTTGAIHGIIRDHAGEPVPGATVVATSPALAGEQVVITDELGAYTLRVATLFSSQAGFELRSPSTAGMAAGIQLGGHVLLHGHTDLATPRPHLDLTLYAEHRF